MGSPASGHVKIDLDSITWPLKAGDNMPTHWLSLFTRSRLCVYGHNNSFSSIYYHSYDDNVVLFTHVPIDTVKNEPARAQCFSC